MDNATIHIDSFNAEWRLDEPIIFIGCGFEKKTLAFQHKHSPHTQNNSVQLQKTIKLPYLPKMAPATKGNQGPQIIASPIRYYAVRMATKDNSGQ